MNITYKILTVSGIGILLAGLIFTSLRATTTTIDVNDISDLTDSLNDSIDVLSSITATDKITGTAIKDKSGSLPTSTIYYKIVSIKDNGTSSTSEEFLTVVIPPDTNAVEFKWPSKNGDRVYYIYLGPESGKENMYVVSTTTTYKLTTTSNAIKIK